MINQMLTLRSPEAAAKLHRIEQHLDAVETEVKPLRKDQQLYRAKDNRAEGKLVRSRIQKTNESILTSFRDVAKAAGRQDEEIDLLVNQNPTVTSLMQDKYRRGLRKNSRKHSDKITK